MTNALTQSQKRTHPLETWSDEVTFMSPSLDNKDVLLVGPAYSGGQNFISALRMLLLPNQGQVRTVAWWCCWTPCYLWMAQVKEVVRNAVLHRLGSRYLKHHILQHDPAQPLKSLGEGSSPHATAYKSQVGMHKEECLLSGGTIAMNEISTLPFLALKKHVKILLFNIATL